MDSSTVAIMNALSAIKGAGGYGIPSFDEVIRAKNGKAWYGEKQDGYHWKLIKHGPASYNVTC